MMIVRYQAAFKKDYKRIKKRGYDVRLLEDIINRLANGIPLDEKHRDHSLLGNWNGYRECHIAPDWLLIYQIREKELVLILTRTGTHAELYSK